MNKIQVTREQGPIGARYRIGYDWADRYLSAVATSRSENTARAYAFDLAIWLAYCRSVDLDPLKAKPRDTLAFVERQLLSRAIVARSQSQVYLSQALGLRAFPVAH